MSKKETGGDDKGFNRRNNLKSAAFGVAGACASMLAAPTIAKA